MLEIKPVCENCGISLPNNSTTAMICTFECTFCMDCVTNVLNNVCPNCGGGFERRPVRPTQCVTKYCVENYPVSAKPYINPVDMEKFEPLLKHYQHIDPKNR